MLKWVFLTLLSVFSLQTAESLNPLQYINSYIGTGGEGYGTGGIPMEVQVPFGMVRLGPDTTQIENAWAPWEHTGGYHYGDRYMRMFSHTHLFGAGVTDYGDIGLFPISNIPFDIPPLPNLKFPWMEHFSHENEITSPYYYSVILSNTSTQVELSATKNVGLHRYTFNNNVETGSVVFDVSYCLNYDGTANSSVTIDYNNQSIYGWIHQMGGLSNRFGGIIVYFYAQFDSKFDSIIHYFDRHKNDGIVKQINLQNTNNNLFTSYGDAIGAIISFSNTQMFEIYVGISFISIDQAKENLNNQVLINNYEFDDVKSLLKNIWFNELNVIELPSVNNSYITNDNITVFYTALYHSLCVPTNFAEENKRYLGFDGKVHTLGDNNNGYYSDMSIWDVHRTQFPLLALIKPDVMSDIINSLVLMYIQGGDLPRWPLANGYTNCMFGTHSNIIIADGIAHELYKNNKFNVSIAYDGMVQSATTTQAHAGRNDINSWLTLGFIPYTSSKNGACLTLAYSYDDWAISKVSLYLNKTSDYNTFYNRSFNYKTQFINNFMCPKYSNNTFNCPKFWITFNDRYTEGDAWHYKTFVPHDTLGLISLYDSVNSYINDLNKFFNESFIYETSYFNGNFLPNIYYWSGNEEDLFAVYQFIDANRSDLTQFYINKLLKHNYVNKPYGIPGNDDYGTMSSWLIWNYIGFYPRSGDGTYYIGSPILNDVVINRNRGNININVLNGNNNNIYVKQFNINSNIYQNNQRTFNIKDIINGGNIQFIMSSNPQM